MRGYPKGRLSKQDFENLLAMPEYADLAREELEEMLALKDDTATIDFTPVYALNDSDRIIKTIDNPSPLWKIVGFSCKEELSSIVSKCSVDKINTINEVNQCITAMK